MTQPKREELIFIPAVDNTSMIFESVSQSPNRFQVSGSSKWDTRKSNVTQPGDLPVVGADIDYGMHDSTTIAQTELPQSSDNGYIFERLEVKGKLDNFYRHPVLLSANDLATGKKHHQNGVIVWMTPMEMSALLPKIPVRVMPSVLKDIKRKFKELSTKIASLNNEVTFEQNGDILNSATLLENFNGNVQVQAFELYQERLELNRLIYGIWLRVMKDDDLEERTAIKKSLLEIFEVQELFSNETNISGLLTKVREVFSETELSRYMDQVDVSQLFGGDVVVPPTYKLVKEVFGYELGEMVGKGLFAELLAVDLSNSLVSILENVSDSGANVLDKRSANWLSGVVYILTNEMLVSIPTSRATKIMKPLWQIIETKFKALGLDHEFNEIKKDLGTNMPDLAEVLTGEDFW